MRLVRDSRLDFAIWLIRVEERRGVLKKRCLWRIQSSPAIPKGDYPAAMHARHVTPTLCDSYRGNSDEPPQSSVIDEAKENVMRHWMRWTLTAVCCVALGPHLRAVGDSFKFATLDFPGASFTMPSGINNRGEIVGQANTASGAHGFLYYKGDFRLIDVPGASGTVASGINDRGQIVGTYSATSASPSQGFLLDGTTFTSIDFPGAFSTNASGINDRGDIVGSYQDANFVFHGFLYDGRHYITINFPGASSTFASGINDRGDIVGSGDFGVSTSVGFVYDGVAFASLIFPGALRNGATGINNPGKIVGSYNSDPVPHPGQAFHGFLFDDHHFTSIDVPGAFSTEPLGINERGQIVGDYTETSGGAEHGFVANP
jgi:probable HAF family extracellular repeat protein